LVPLAIALQRRPISPYRAAALGWATGAVFYAGLIPWLPATIARLQHRSALVGWVCTALFVAYHAAQFGAAGLIMRWASPPRSGRRVSPLQVVHAAALAASGWIALEWGFPKVFPWSLGAAIGPSPTLRQAADLAGPYGLAAAIVMINMLLAARRLAGVLAAGAGLAALAAYGVYRTGGQAAAAVDGPRVGIVQGGAVDAAWTGYAQQSPALAARSDVVVWPESVLRGFAADAGDLRDALERFAARLRRPLILGALDHGAGERERNAVLMFAPQLVAVRHKRHLVPFGEYVPGAAWLPWLHVWRTTGALEAGPDVGAPLRIATAPAALTVCVEAVRAGAFNASVRGGAQWLLNLTDDSWFASGAAAAQHVEMARLRAVETRRWLVRASHSGASAVFDAQGNLVAALPFGAAGVLSRRIELRSDLTWYVRGGDWIVAAAFGLLAVELARCRCQARSNNSTSAPVSACMVTADSSLTAAPSPACNAVPFSVTSPRATCSQA
jgi:apolipoprotein N-acyltransferase